MTATDQIREALQIHRERCELCIEDRPCAVAAGIAHDLRRAQAEEERQADLFEGRARLENARRDCYDDAKRKGIL